MTWDKRYTTNLIKRRSRDSFFLKITADSEAAFVLLSFLRSVTMLPVLTGHEILKNIDLFPGLPHE